MGGLSDLWDRGKEFVQEKTEDIVDWVTDDEGYKLALGPTYWHDYIDDTYDLGIKDSLGLGSPEELGPIGAPSSEYDAVFNARMANIAEQNQGISNELYDFWKNGLEVENPNYAAYKKGLDKYNKALWDKKVQYKMSGSTVPFNEYAKDELMALGMYKKNNPAQEQYNTYSYRDFETDKLLANQSLLPGQTELAKKQMAFDSELIDRNTGLLDKTYENAGLGLDLEKGQIGAQQELLPLETGLRKTQIDTESFGLAEAKKQMLERSPIVSEYYKQALKGTNVDSAMNMAQSDTVLALKGAERENRLNAARMGVNPASGRYATSSIDKAKAIAQSRTAARVGTDATNFNKLQSASNLGIIGM